LKGFGIHDQQGMHLEATVSQRFHQAMIDESVRDRLGVTRIA